MSARVKAVQTGDCLILSANGEDKQVFLAYIQVPRITEPFGFAAREYLRKFALNKPVRYRALYEVNGREHGDASSPVFNSLVEHMLQQGWGQLRNDASSRPGFTPQLGERLEAAQQEAQTKHLGIWSEKLPKPTVHLLTDVPADVYGSGRKVPAIVEKVQNGDRVILRAMFRDDEHFVGLAFLGGIRTRPSTTATGTDGTASTLSAAAVSAVEARLLQREVRVIFHAPHNTGHPLVTLVHPQGDIAQLLVGLGLAEVQQTPQIGSENVLALRNAQQDAMTKGVGMWKAAALQKQAQSQQFAHLPKEGTVIKVVSADTFVVDGQSLQLSSVRAPRKGENPEGAQDAREFARKLLIGQKVKISVDGSSSHGPAGSESHPEEPRVTLSFGPGFSKNAGLEIIRAGWATTLHHRRDDLARSPFYDEFVAAEEKAEKSQLGIFKKANKKGAQPRATQDASESVVRARAYLASLQRRGSFPAVVDFVISAGRLRLNVPSENCTIVTVLDGARAPGAGAPFSEEALAFVNREWNQRDVTCSVRSVDKTGAFVSTVSIGRRSLANDLVERGLAKVFGSAHPELEDAEDVAQSKRLGVWSIEEPESSASATAPESTTPSSASAAATSASTPASTTSAPVYKDAVIAHVTPSEIFVRLAQQESKHRQLQSALREFFTAAANASARSFKSRPQRRTPVVDAKTYERAIVTAVRASSCEVDFIDTGAKETRDVSELLPLPPQFGIGGDAKVPALAQAITLQYVHRPVKFYTDAFVEYVEKYVGKPVVVYGNTILLADSKSAGDSLNYRLVAAGLASVPVADANEEQAQRAIEAQEEAQHNRVGMWEYGDPREDDDM